MKPDVEFFWEIWSPTETICLSIFLVVGICGPAHQSIIFGFGLGVLSWASHLILGLNTSLTLLHEFSSTNFYPLDTQRKPFQVKKTLLWFFLAQNQMISMRENVILVKFEIRSAIISVKWLYLLENLVRQWLNRNAFKCIFYAIFQGVFQKQKKFGVEEMVKISACLSYKEWFNTIFKLFFGFGKVLKCENLKLIFGNDSVKRFTIGSKSQKLYIILTSILTWRKMKIGWRTQWKNLKMPLLNTASYRYITKKEIE